MLHFRPQRVIHTARIVLPMDQAKSKSPKPKQKSKSKTKKDSQKDIEKRMSNSYHFDGGLFNTVQSPRKQFFTIHPDWVSETLHVQKMNLTERQRSDPQNLGSGSSIRKSATFPYRRCRSAPPPNIRNPITWEGWEPISRTPPYRSRNPITWEGWEQL